VTAPLLVTPEAVLLDLTTAGVPTRVLGRLLDLVIQVVAAILFTITLGAASGASILPDSAALVLVLFFVPLIVFGYPIGFEAAMRGRTPGKAAMGLRVVTKEGAPIRFRHAVIRGALDIVDLLGLGIVPGVPGIVTMFCTHDGQRLGDLVAGTLVIRERTAARAPTSTSFAVPHGYEAYAATVDVSRLSETDHQAARSFLLRAGSLDPAAREHIAAQLAAGISARIGLQPPPSWVQPVQLLTILVARRQQRGGTVAGPLPAPPPPAAAPPASAIWPGTAPVAPAPAFISPPASASAVARPPAPDSGFAAPS
jgi:uncharacterized RDD family membrane protein YckC